MVALWFTYVGAGAFTLWLTRRFVRPIPWPIGALLLALPLLFTGKAVLTGRLYGPADLYYTADPWKRVTAEQGVESVRNPILSDVAFQGFPWRAALKESAGRARLPLWNRFILAGNPLLGSGQAAAFHPSTLVALPLALPLSATLSSTFTIFLSLLCGAVYFRDLFPTWPPVLVGAVGWAFSTSLLFWNGYAEGLTLVFFPLLLSGVRRLAAKRTVPTAGLTAAALLLLLTGGQPETFFFCAAAAAVAFLWELRPHGWAAAKRSLSLAVVAAALAFLLSAPLVFPLVQSIRHSSEYAARRQTSGPTSGRQSVSAREAARRLLPAWLPFSHGIYGRSPVDWQRRDGSGEPLAYAGSVLFPLALVALTGRSDRPRGRSLFLGFALAGLLFGASAPGLLDFATRLPGFSLARNYRLVFLAGLGLSGLAAFGAAEAGRRRRALFTACAAAGLLLSGSFLLARGVFAERMLPPSFLREAFAFELVPVLALGFVAAIARRRTASIAAIAVALLAFQRAMEMGGTYPTLPASLLSPPLPTLSALPPTTEPYRVTAAGDVFRPNASALYGLEDVRGYDSIVLDRFAETYPLWCQAQWASFNRVDRLDAPFLAFLNVRFAIASPEAEVPRGWIERARGREMAVFENPRALPRAFAPRRLRFQPDPAPRLAAMKAAPDFGMDCWLSSPGTDRENGSARLFVRQDGADLLLRAAADTPALIATSVPDWPGWRVAIDGEKAPAVTVNHAFVGFHVPAGRHEVRLTYRPASVSWGIGAFALGLVACGALGVAGRRVSGGIPAPEAS